MVLSIMDTLQLVFLLLMRMKLKGEHRDIWVSWWFKYTYMGFIFFSINKFMKQHEASNCVKWTQKTETNECSEKVCLQKSQSKLMTHCLQ